MFELTIDMYMYTDIYTHIYIIATGPGLSSSVAETADPCGLLPLVVPRSSVILENRLERFQRFEVQDIVEHH